ncbi:CDP-archaeol synthase [Candidatus Woesearchaeota archaeon]|nr:CDP-archaeol synthase [Candidatus Woesearchaeota archaeon]
MMLFSIIYLLIPAAIANIIPVFVKKINFLNYPVDFGFKIYNKRIFGINKTWRGLFFGILGSILFVFIQSYLFNFEFFKILSLVDYSTINIFILGLLLGISVLVGDLIGSFIKRQLNFKPGQSFYFLDQLDGAIGLVLFFVPFYFNNFLETSLWILVVWTFGHFIIKYLGYLFRISDEKI